MLKLSDICSIKNGGTPSSKEKSYWGSEIEWLTPKDMGKLTSRCVSRTERQITEEGLSNSSAKLVPAKSIILSCRAPIGHVAINEVPMSFNQGCKGLIPNNKITTPFLYYFLLSSKHLLNKLGKGTTFKEISANTLSNVPISVPPLAEQQRIVAKLDAVFVEIDRAALNTKNAINQAELLSQKIIDDNIHSKMSGATQIQLKKFCNIKHGYAFDGKSFSQSDDESKPIVLTPGNFAENGTTKFTQKNTKRLLGQCNKELLFSLNDLVVVMTDLSSKMLLLGKPAFIRQPNILHNQRIGLVQNNEQVVLNDYLYFYFKSTKYLSEIKRTASGTMVRHTAPKRILDNYIEIPKSLTLQRQISEKISNSLSNITTLISAYEDKVGNLVALKSAILTQELQNKAA